MADKITEVYNALKADGQFKQARSLGDFKAKMAYSGYRAQIYKNLRDAGADVGTFSHFTQALGYKSGSPQPKSKATAKPAKNTWTQPSGSVDSSATKSAADRAMQLVNADAGTGGSTAEAVDYLGRPQSEMPKYGKGPSGDVSSFVQSLYSQDDAQRSGLEQAPYTAPRGKKEDSAFVQNQKRRLAKQKEFNRGAATIDGMLRNYEKKRNQPMVDTGSPEANENIVRPMGVLEDDLAKSGKEFTEKNLDNDINEAIFQEFKDAHKRGLEAEGNEYFQHGFGGSDWYIGEKKYQQQQDPDVMIKSLSQKMSSFVQSPSLIKRVKGEAAKFGVSPEDYAKNAILPSLLEKASNRLMEEDVIRHMPQSTASYIIGGVMDSVTGAVLAGLTTSRQQRINQQSANQMTDEGLNKHVQPGMWAKAARGAVSYAADAPLFGAAGVGAGAVVNKLFGTAAKQAMMAANQTLFQRIGTGVVRGAVHGGVTGFQYGFVNGAVQNFSTGEDTSLGNTLKSSVLGGLGEAASFAAMEGMGGVVGAFGHKVGLRGTEKGFWQNANKIGQKAVYEVFKTGMEGIGMATGGVASSAVRSALTGEDFRGFTVEGTLESCASAAVFKLMHAKELFKKEVGADGKPFSYKQSIANKVGRFFVSDELKGKLSGNVFTTDERNQLMSAGSNIGMKPMENFINWAKQTKKTNAKDVELGEDGSGVLNYYEQMMQDPNLSWDLKAKFTTLVMGTMPSGRPMMDSITFSTEHFGNEKSGYNKYVNEYAADGTLLSKRVYDDVSTRDKIIYEIKANNEEHKLWNALAVIQMQDRDKFFADSIQGLGNEDIYAFADGLGVPGSAVSNDFARWLVRNGRGEQIAKAIAEKHGVDVSDFIKALHKNYNKRTDVEQKMCFELRKAVEKEAFPEEKPHPEQSAEDGKDVVSENGLGTDKPNGEAVVSELRGLKQAENDMSEMMKDNDVFSQHFEKLQKQGLSHPEIYQWMIDNGVTAEQLEPYARYMNQVAKVQGIQKATTQAIEEYVGLMGQDWGFHGTMDGQKADGSQVLYVQDKDGRMLIVGSGEVAYDATDGHAKEGVGDMLVCLDPNTREVVCVKAEDTTLFQTQDVEAFKNEERQRLQSINSVPYNQAAQEQAAAEAAKPEAKDEAQPSEQPQQGDVEIPQQNYTLSEKKAGNGEQFYQDENGSIDLATIPDEVFDSIGYTKAPFRLTPSMIRHMLDRHNKELKFNDENEAIHFVRDVMANFDHVRLGSDGALVFSIENGRNRTGKRAITILINSDNGQFYGLKTSGYEGIKGLERRPLLWERGANKESSSTDAASAIVPTSKSSVSGEQSGSASNQSIGLGGKDTNNSPNNNENNTSLTFKDGTAVPMDANREPDFMQMTPEQGVEVYKMLFPKTYEAEVDNTIKMLEADLKGATKAKPKSKGMMSRAKEQAEIDKAVALAEAQVERAKEIKKAIVSGKVAKTVGGDTTEEANTAGSEAAKKFKNAPRLVGNKRTRTLPDGKTKVRGHYEIVPAESLTPSHDAMNGYKKSAGFPTDAEGRTVNDRDYENDKAAQQTTDQMALKYNGQAIDAVPTVSDEGIVYDGNGRTMAGQKAAKEGTDGEYVNDLLENAENFGFTREQIEQSGIGHPRLVLVTDERLPYDTATFAKFNRNEKKTQSNTEQAVAKAKTLTADEVGSIVAEIEGNGSLDAFFKNPKAINELVKTLLRKGIIGQNEVAELMEGTGRLSPQGKELVKNLLLGSIFKPETIRMLGIDSAIKTKAIAGIRAVMDNMKLGDYSLRDEIDQAIQLLYEARQGGNKVDTLLRTPDMYGENAASRYPSISQMMALALEGNVSDFRDLLNEYNKQAAAHNTGEGNVFGDVPSKEELIKEFLDFKKWKDYDTRGNSKTEGGDDVSGVQETKPEASGGNEGTKESQQQVDDAIKGLAIEITKQTGVPVHTDEKESQQALEEAEATDSNIKYHKETDEETLARLEKEPKVKVYRAMQVIDGKLYPPMAASVDGKLVEANELGTWIRADENPDLAIPDIDPKTGKQKVDAKTGELKWKFKLDKGGKDATGKKATSIPAAYNPYWHLSRSPLNDQFKSAWIRPNIVVVECEVPESELTSGYKAERAKDAVGEVDWKSGSVSGEVFKQTGRARKVILSRWCKPVRVLDDAEVAQKAKEFVGDAKVEIPENVLTPKQRIAFEEAGFKIGAPEKGVKKSDQIVDALKAGLEIDNTVREHRGDAGGAVLDWGNVPTKARISNDELTSIIMRNNRAYVDELDNLKDGDTIEHYVDANGFLYIFRVDKNHHIYMDEAIPKNSSANLERIEELKNYYDGERTRYPKEVYPNRREAQSELGRSEDSNRSTAGGGDKPDSAMGGEWETNSANNVERDSSRLEKTSPGTEVRQFRTKDGEVYGFVVDGEIHLDTKKMKPETPLHEYTHLWSAALQRVNAKEWENVKKLLDDVDELKEEVQKLYPELKGDDLYDEMLAMYSGREGTKKLEAEARRLAEAEGKKVYESVKAKGFLKKVKEALKAYWKGVADMLGIHFTSAEEVADKVLADWAGGVDPTKMKGEEEKKHLTPEEKAAMKEKEMQEHPLTMEEIDSYDTGNAEDDEFAKMYAKEYLNGDRTPISVFFYNAIYDHVRNSRQDSEGDSKPADTAHVDGGSDEGGQPGGGGEPTEPLGEGTGGKDVPKGGGNAGEAGEIRAAAADGEKGHKPVGGKEPEMDGVPGGSQRPGRGGKPGGKDGADGPKPARGDGAGAGGTKQDAQAAFDASKQELSDLLAELNGIRKKNKADDKGKLNAYPGLVSAVVGELAKKMLPRNKEEMVLYAKIMKASAKVAYNGLRMFGEKAEAWFKGMRENLHDAIKNAYGDVLTDEDVDNFIKSLWGSKYEMDGKVQTIEQWASEIGNEKLRKALRKSIDEKRKDQRAAEKVKVKVGDADNIAETLPFLLPEQQDDVLKAETRFFGKTDEKGKKSETGIGMMFTNGTGTGKTYTGLGIAKRFEKMGKKRILIVTPSPEKVRDWHDDAKNLGIDLTILEKKDGKGATANKGEGAVVTTYANFRANKALLEDTFDLVIYDESHKLMENKDASESATTKAHYKMTNRDFYGAQERLMETHPLWQEEMSLEKEKGKLLNGNADTESARLDPMVKDADIKRLEQIDARLDDLHKEQQKALPEINKKAREAVGKTKVVFLSATPFNMRENLDYAEGYLFSYGAEMNEESKSAWMDARQRAKNSFFRQWFPNGEEIGPNGKIRPLVKDADKNDEEERKFSDHLQEMGVLSGRTIENGYDYSRDFPVVSISHADKFNTALSEMASNPLLAKFAQQVFGDYNTMSVVYETMKVSAIAQRLKDHMAMGRKIVVFHRRVNDRLGLAQPPFSNALKKALEFADMLEHGGQNKDKAFAAQIKKEVHTFMVKNADLLKWEKSLDYRMPRQQLKSLMGDAHSYTAEEMKKYNECRGEYIDKVFGGKSELSPYEAGKKFGEACFDLEDADVVDDYKPHRLSAEEAEMMGVKQTSDTEFKKQMAAYKKIADEVRRGIEDNIRDRIKKGELAIELDEKGKRKRKVGLFAGADSKDQKHDDIEAFNDDDSGMDIIVVQEASGKEGISLHDRTGKHQRVMVNLALPQSPIAFIQAEGRIFRIGQMSNAIFEYPLLGIDNEIALFAGKFNGRAATTENLALGSMARGLKDAITRGVLMKTGKVPLQSQGMGGKAWDLREDQKKQGYDAAVDDYKDNKEHEDQTVGLDDSATPEPLGYKMVEWAEMNEGESALEPSAGAGSVSRYIPSNVNSLSIEPNTKKRNRLMLLTGGVERGTQEAQGRKTLVSGGTFEELKGTNKFDTIVMNAPDGEGNETAKAHLEKALTHLNDSGRLVAVLPDTKDMRDFVKKLTDENTSLHVAARVTLPGCAFSKGGESRKTFVLTMDKLTREEVRKKWKETVDVDLSGETDMDGLFRALKDVKVPKRVMDPVAKDMKHGNVAVGKLKGLDIFKTGRAVAYANEDAVRLYPSGKFESALEYCFTYTDDYGKTRNTRPILMDVYRYKSVKGLERNVLRQYSLFKEVLGMSDEEIASKCFDKLYVPKNKQAVYVDNLRQYCEAMAKMIRGVSGRTDGELMRAFKGEDIDNAVVMTAGAKLSMNDLHNVFDANNKSEELAGLFDKVYSVAKDLGLEISVYNDPNSRTSAYYSNENVLRINANFWNAKEMIDNKGRRTKMDNQLRAEVLTHELIHSVTSYANYWYDHDPDMLSPELREAAGELDSLYNTIMNSTEAYNLPMYARENKNELVAESANGEVREALKHMGLWTRFVNAIKKFFTGHDKDMTVRYNENVSDEDFTQSSAYNELSKVLDKYLNNFDRNAYDAYVALSGRRTDRMFDVVGEDGTHFRTDRGVQYSKTDEKDVKNSRIIPEDVDKSVSSQIEKKFDETINNISLSAEETFAGDIQSKVDYATSLYSNMPRENVEYYKTYYENEIAKLSRGTRYGRSSGQHGSSRDREPYLLSNARTHLAAIERELAYRDSRAKAIRDNYGLQEGRREISPDLVERIFKDGNPSKGQAQLFTKAFNITKRLGVDFALDSGADTKASGETTIFRDLNLFLDGLVRTRSPKDSLPRTMLHEMLHQATMGAINLVKKGKADGMLTPKQIEGVKTILDLYDKVKDYKERFEEEPYGLKNEYEFAAQMADPRQRKALDLDVWDRIKNAAKELANKGDRSMWQTFKDAIKKLFEISDKDKMDQALNDIMDDFNEKIDDISMNDIEQDGFAYKVEDKDDAPVVVKHVDKIARKLGAKVNMVQSVGDITNKSAKAAIERGENVTGWYDEKTGEVHLYMPNIHDRYTAEKTIWHEVVGHKGMRELFGDENYSKFLRSIWYDLDKPENARLKELVSEELRYNPFDFENGIEEGIARLVEDGKGEPGFWNAIKNKVTDILHEIGYRIAPNTKDVKYLLWLGKNLQKNPNDPYWKMRADAVRYKLEREKDNATVVRDGEFAANDGKTRTLEEMSRGEYENATDGMVHFRSTPSVATALDRYQRELDKHGYMFTESFMDNMLSVKKLMMAIVPDAKDIVDINSSENPYMLQNTLQGAMSMASQMYERNVMDPLSRKMAELMDAFDGKNDDERTRDFNLYMITKHGLERNRVLYMRDALEEMRNDEQKKKMVDEVEKDWYDELDELNDKLDKGVIDLKGYFDGMDDFIRTEVDGDFKADEHDYSGIHAIQGIRAKDPYDDAEAIASVMDKEGKMESIGKGSVKEFWGMVKKATDFAVDTEYNNGIIRREVHGYVKGMFNWYVPLRKHDEKTAEDYYGYITEKSDPKTYIGSVLMRASGHKYLSETNVLAQIGAMANHAILKGGQNAMKQAFARLVRNHPENNLVTETSVWYVDDPVTKTTKERYPEIPEDATPDEVNQIVADFNSEMRDLESKGLATKVRRRGRIGYKFERAENKSQHIVDVMIAGRKHSFIINGNPRAAQALNGLLENWNGNGHKVAKWAVDLNGKITRFFAQACTSYNPEFVMRNLVKDYEFSTLNLLAKEGSRYVGTFEKYYLGLVPLTGAKSLSLKDFKNGNGLGLFAKYRNGTLDMNNKVHRYFKEFMENGGETGFVQVLNMRDWTKKYKKEIRANRSGAAKAAKILKDGVFGSIESLNEVAENMARFATYCASRDHGRSIVRSTYDAKEVTVNFNRHGSGSEITSFKNGELGYGKAARRNIYGITAFWLRHTNMFFNAGIQSTNMLMKTAKAAPKATAGVIAGTPFALGALMPLVNQMLMGLLDDDEKDRKGAKDPYIELPDYVRRNNLCIYTGGGEFATIPLAIETRAFYGLGDLAADVMRNGEMGWEETSRQAAGQVAQLVPVMDFIGTKDFGDNPAEAAFQAFSPSSIEPIIEWERNKDWRGQQIERRGDFYENDPAWERANSGTNSALMWLNKKVNAMTNDVQKGNEEMLGNGFLDQITNPSMLEHFGGGIGKGMSTFGGKVIGVGKKLAEGDEVETKDIPFVRSFFYTPSETSSMQRTKNRYYNYADELAKDLANVRKLTAKTDDPVKMMENASAYNEYMKSKKAQQIEIFYNADKQIKNIRRMRNKQTDTEVIRMADQQIGLIMQDAVDRMDKLND